MAVVEKTSSFKSLTALSDAEGKNNSSLNGRQYRDLDLFFTKRSKDKDVNTLSNVQAVKRSVRNLVLTNFYEKPFHPEIGSNIRQSLFEPLNTLTAGVLTHNITNVLETHEPRILLHRVDCTPDINRNAYNVRLDFFIINATTELISFEFILERIR